MDPRLDGDSVELDFRVKSTQHVAMVAAIVLAPFVVNNFYQGRPVIGFAALAVATVLALSAWSISRGRYNPTLTLIGMVPTILVALALALHKEAIIGVLWCYPALISFYFILPERKAWGANALLLALALPLAWHSLHPSVAMRASATMLAVSAFAAIFVRVIGVQQKKLEALAVTDPLTGVLNRALLHATLDQAIEQSGRTGTPMALIALDLDHFKSINDTYGHDAGDTALRGVGKLLSHRVRLADKVFRLGGEEFLVFLYGTGEEDAASVAEDLRREIEAYPVIDVVKVTASLGVAALQRGEKWSDWMKRVDQNLYRAKAEGRNRVVS